MGGRHQNVEDPITQTQDMRKTKFDQGGFFWPHFKLLNTINIKQCMDQRCGNV
jgi:hypothetical protein